jgi:hypothetical protein
LFLEKKKVLVYWGKVTKKKKERKNNHSWLSEWNKQKEKAKRTTILDCSKQWIDKGKKKKRWNITRQSTWWSDNDVSLVSVGVEGGGITKSSYKFKGVKMAGGTRAAVDVEVLFVGTTETGGAVVVEEEGRYEFEAVVDKEIAGIGGGAIIWLPFRTITRPWAATTADTSDNIWPFFTNLQGWSVKKNVPILSTRYVFGPTSISLGSTAFK